MARPRKDQEGACAKERIAEAFWSMLFEMQYEDIKIVPLAKRAKVSPNTLYYHFNGLMEVARFAIAQDMAPEVIITIFEDGGADGKNLREDDRFQHVVRIAQCGNAELEDLLAASIRDAWLAKMGVSEDELTASQALDLNFIFGGVMSMLKHFDGSDASINRGFFDRPLGRAAVETLRALEHHSK